MRLLTALLEMDSMMRPVGGPVNPPDCKIKTDDAFPNKRYNSLLSYLQHRAMAEDEEEVDNDEQIRAIIIQVSDPVEVDFRQAAQSLDISVEQLHRKVWKIAHDLLNSDDTTSVDLEQEQQFEDNDDRLQQY